MSTGQDALLEVVDEIVARARDEERQAAQGRINDLAYAVQGHVAEQPWGSYGNAPVPIEMWFNDGTWTVRFVIALSRGTQRKWHTVKGEDLLEVLKDARARQHMVSLSSEPVATDSGFRRHQIGDA